MLLLRPLEESYYLASIAEACADRLREVLQDARDGHCMRVDDLPLPIMEKLCTTLSQELGHLDICLVGHTAGPEAWRITATKAIEMRNLQRKPLLLFVPVSERMAAEDSFGESTFSQVSLAGAMTDLVKVLRVRLNATIEGLTDVTDFARHHCTQDQLVRYLLTVESNGSTPEAAGRALYELNLIPDGDLFDDLDKVQARLGQYNRASVELLVDPSFPVTARVHNLKLLERERAQVDKGLFQLLSSVRTCCPREWGQRIATEDAWAGLSLEHWPFVDALSGVQDLQMNLFLPLMEVRADGLAKLELSGVGDHGFRIKWETSPPAYQVPSLDHYRIELVSTNDTVVYASGKIRKSKGRSSKQSKDLKELSSEAVPDGVYYFRISAFTKDGLPLPVRPFTDEQVGVIRSEDLWVYTDEDTPEEGLNEPRFAQVSSFAEGYLLALVDHLRRREADPLPEPAVAGVWERGKRSMQCPLQFGNDYVYTVYLSRVLGEIEEVILAEPSYLGVLLLDFTHVESDDVQVERLPAATPTVGELDAFRRERERLFSMLREKGGVVETTDLRPLAAEIEAYVDTYHRLLRAQPSQVEGTAAASWLTHDQVEVRLPGGRLGETITLYLLSPTHPLRLLWVLQHQLTVTDWMSEVVTRRLSGKAVTELRDLMRYELRPSQLPPVLVGAGTSNPVEEFYVEAGHVTALWSVYVRQKADRGLMLRLAELLGVRAKEQRYDEQISARELGSRLVRYVEQHPYVNPLVINAVRPGEGRDLVQSLLQLSVRYPDLRYKVNLFGDEAQFDQLGLAFEELLDPTRSNTDIADLFSDSGSLLVPKLVYSRVNSAHLQDGARSGPRYSAHVTVLYDPFPVTVQLRDQLRAGVARSSFIHGLSQSLATTWSESDGNIAWRRQLVPTDSQDIRSGHGYPAKLATVLEAWGEAMGMVLAGRHRSGQAPALVLVLTGAERSLLRGVHELSDWVITVDRHMGIEFFDQQEETYLLDYTPEYASLAAERVILTTSAMDEVQSLLASVFTELDLEQTDALTTAVLRSLRSLSGRLPMALSSSAATRRKEVVGLALSRFFLERMGAINRCIIIPLDAHRNWFTSVQDASGQRSDLLLVFVDPENKSLHCRLVEVKVRTTMNSAAAYQQLRNDISSQLNNSETVLRQRFDPENGRIDWAVQAKELMDVLQFYLDRAIRYRSVDAELADTLGQFLNHLDEGFALSFDRWALVFDLANEGYEFHEEAGVCYHRIGKERAQAIVSDAVTVERTRLEATVATGGAVWTCRRRLTRSIVRFCRISSGPSPQDIGPHLLKRCG